MRPRICVFLSSIGVTGYLMFNPPGLPLFFVALSSFFGIAAAYSFNNITDTEEDMINRKKISSLAGVREGVAVVALFSVLSVFFSLFLPLFSTVSCLAGIAFGIIYSFFKLKKYLLLKNFYTAFSGSLVFLVGATFFSPAVMGCYLVFSFFLFIASAISDLRDYEGDRKGKINTMPVSFGYDTAKKIILLLLVLLSVVVALSPLPVLLPLTFLMFYFLVIDKPVFAHSILGASFVFSALWSFVVLV